MTEVKETALETKVENTTVEAAAETVTTEAKEEVAIPEKYQGKDINAVIQMHQEAEKLIGKKMPGAPEKYIVPEETSEDIKELLIATGKDHNMTQEQVNALANKFVEASRLKEAADKGKAEEHMADQKAALEKEFGSTLDSRLDAVKSILTQYGDDDTKEMLKSSGLLHDAKFVKFLDKITGDVLKHTAVASDYTESRGHTPEEAVAAIESKKADAAFMEQYTNKRNPGHKLAVQEWNKLFDTAYKE